MSTVRLLPWIALAAACPSPANAADLSGDVGLVSDYRYRGISLSGNRPALQASATLEHDSGVYVNGWASTVDGPLSKARTEVDLTAGYETDLGSGISLDLSGTWYLYPSNTEPDYVEASAILGTSVGQASASLGASIAPSQSGTGHHGNFYLFAEAAYEMRDTPVTFTARLGRERGWFDEVENGGKWDWSVSAEARIAPARIGLSYAGCNVAGERARLVGSLFFDF
jgi:uncharacterized protein (TIGR02001 family)